MEHTNCVKARQESESGAAALVMVAQWHGVELELEHLPFLLGNQHLEWDLYSLLIAARHCGFEAVPLEGSFHELAEVKRPNIVIFQADDKQQYVVLLEINNSSATIGNTLSGKIERLSKKDFCARWSGDAIQILPHPTDIVQAQQKLQQLKTPWFRVRKHLGWHPPYGPKLTFLVLVGLIAAVIVLFGTGSEDPSSIRPRIGIIIQATAIGLALIGSLWLWAFPKACRSCDTVAQLVGTLPLVHLGYAFYALCLVIRIATQQTTLLAWMLSTASGIHFYLLWLLIVSRTPCLGCMVVALAAFTATGIAVSQAAILPWWFVSAVVGGLGVAWGTIRLSYRLNWIETQQGNLDLADRVIKEGDVILPNQAKVVVYKRRNCPTCFFYDNVIRPAIEADFGTNVVIDERWIGDEKADAPLYVVLGAMHLVLFNLSTEDVYEKLQKALALALGADQSFLGPLGGLHVIDGGRQQ